MRPWGGGSSRSVWHWSPAAESHFYGAFWSGMPDLNYKNPEVTREAVAIGRHWLARGAAGFRFDAARYLIEDGPYPAQADTPATAPGGRTTTALWARSSTPSARSG
jgi:glycosidase